MAYKKSRKRVPSWLLPLALVGGMYSCGSSSDDAPGVGPGGSGTGKPNGATCAADGECVSGVCSDAGLCAGSGQGAPAGSDCSSDGDCASGSCVDNLCAPGSGLDDGASCSEASECASGQCTGGVCGSGSTGGGGTPGSGTGGGALGDPCTGNTECESGLCVANECATPGPGGTVTTPGAHFPGSGTGYRPLVPGCGPDTAALCTGECEQMGGDPDVSIIRPPATLCFYGPEDTTPDSPAAVIEQVIEELDGVAYVHIRITFDPTFTDNTYGEGACCGWGQNRGHTFTADLTKSDHSELLLTNADGETIINFKVDLVSPDAGGECKGFDTLGVEGGDGSVISGDPADVLAVATSTSRNINGCGYCDNEACAPSGDCTIDSPATDDMFTANPDTANWDYRIVYEAWIALDAFGDSGFGQAYITYVHSSPGKGTDTINTEGGPCPPEWDTPYCPPDVATEGGNCFGSPPGGSAGATGSGGGPGDNECEVNWQLYISTEGAAICTPIPFAGYPDMAPCPAGYHLDLASEGRYCLPG